MCVVSNIIVSILLALDIMKSLENTELLAPNFLWAASSDLLESALSIISSYRRLALWAISIQADSAFTYSNYLVFSKVISLFSLLLCIARANKNNIADLKFFPFNSRL